MSEAGSVALDVILDEPGWTEALPDAQAVVRRTIAHASAAERAEGVVVVLLTDSDALKGWNSQFRGLDKATNVLAFPAPEDAKPILGDIAIAFGVVAEEAAAQGKSIEAHLAHLTLHGFLHLLGYDHEIEAEAEAMETRETALLAELGYPNPY